MRSAGTIIINSCGRSGSTILYRWVVRNAGRSKALRFISHMRAARNPNIVYKTHSYPEKLCLDAKIVYVYGELKNVSLSVIGAARKSIERNPGWLAAHLAHMFVKPEHKNHMVSLFKQRKWDMLEHYIIQDDKLRLKEHIKAWSDYDKRLLIRYEDFYSRYSDVKMEIEDYLGFEMDDIEIKKRSTDWISARPATRQLLIETYPSNPSP